VGLCGPAPHDPTPLQSVTVLEALDGLAAQHGEAGVPFKKLEEVTRSRLSFRALTEALNALVRISSMGCSIRWKAA
jgi:hypothetical protein